MGNYDLSYGEDYGRFKTIRRKRRLLKEDRDKQLIQVYKRMKEIQNKLRNLPMVPLEVPYQRGWLRTFVLRQDVAISKDAPFFQNLLDKINTVQYSHKRMFQIKRRKRGKKIYENRPQYLEMLDPCQWYRNNFRIGKKGFKLTEKERKYFSIKEMTDWYGRLIYVHYFNEQWRIVLKVKPNIVTHVQLYDCELVSQMKVFNNYLNNHNLHGRMHRLVKGRKYNYIDRERNLDQHINKGLHQLLDHYEYTFTYEHGN